VNRFVVLLLFCFVLLNSNSALAQTDSLSLLHSPRKATIMSALLPGAGQAYNKKYWKMPIIYAGFAGLGYLVKVNNDDYKTYKNAYSDRLDDDPATVDNYVDIYSDEDLVTLKDYYRRNRDLSAIGIGILYILNVLDAAVDAHLFYFSVNDELTMHVVPGYNLGAGNGPVVSLNFQF